MAVSWGFSVLLVVTLVALFTFTQPMFQLAMPDLAVEKLTPTDSESIVSQAAAVLRGHNSNPLDTFKASDAGFLGVNILRRGGRRSQRSWTRKQLIQQRSVVDPQHLKKRVLNNAIPRRSVLASFQSDRMVPTGPNPLHNSNRSQVIFP